MAGVASQDLRGYVGGRPAIGVCSLGYRLQLFCKAEVNEFDVAPLCHRDDEVLWLQVSVDDVIIMQEL